MMENDVHLGKLWFDSGDAHAYRQKVIKMKSIYKAIGIVALMLVASACSVATATAVDFVADDDYIETSSDGTRNMQGDFVNVVVGSTMAPDSGGWWKCCLYECA